MNLTYCFHFWCSCRTSKVQFILWNSSAVNTKYCGIQWFKNIFNRQKKFSELHAQTSQVSVLFARLVSGSAKYTRASKSTVSRLLIQITVDGKFILIHKDSVKLYFRFVPFFRHLGDFSVSPKVGVYNS